MAARSQDKIFRNRTAVVAAFLMLFAGALLARLFELQVVKGGQARKLAENQHSIYKKLLPSRGEIKIIDKFTLETHLLATNIKKFLVYAVPDEIKDPELASQSLSSVLGIGAEEIKEKITNRNRKYVPLKKQLTEEEQEKIKGLKLKGIYFDSEDTRFYPEKNLLSQVLGFVGFKGDKKAGLYGLEREFESELAGLSGALHLEKDTAGAWIFGAKRDLLPARDGVNLVLTIDKNIQFKAETVLKETVSRHGADGGTVIVVDPKTGAILAMAGYPDFDPNEYNKVEDPALFLNKAATGSYEPGSIFKPLTLAAAVNEGKIAPETTYVDNGSVVIDGYTIKNSDNKAHGVQTMSQVLEKSLNTGVIYAKDQIGNETFYRYLRSFGFGQETGVELPEGKGNLDNLKANIKVNFHTASFGQGITVTPLQMVQAFTAIAHGGKMAKPFIVQAKVYPDGRVENTDPSFSGEIISPRTANTIAAMMVNVVESGHGKRAGAPGYYIAGKTGTAQVARKDGRGYEEKNNIGSFIGFGPVEDPRFLMLVRIDRPRTVSFAESTAAPAFGELAQFILNYLRVPPTRK